MKNPINLIVIILLLAVSNLSAATLYVSLESTNPTPPYATWAMAATNIQDAVDVATSGHTVVVTNGVYPGGVSVTKPLTLLSVNGPQFTVIDGGGTVQCIGLTDGASLSGFTLTNGMAYGGDGGGVSCTSTNAFITNCVIAGNSAGNGGGASYGTLYNCTLSGNSAVLGSGGGCGGGAWGCTLYSCTLSGNSTVPNAYGNANPGGGAYGCTLYNCMLWGNRSGSGAGGGGAYNCTLYSCTLCGNSADRSGGGGADDSTLYNCTLTGNSADTTGGGTRGCVLYNCILYYNNNTGSNWANYDSSSTLNYCCTTPLPTNGVGNIALDPQLASASHLSLDSPCRRAGGAAYATGTDIDGEPWGNPPSIGCDEYRPGAVTGPLTVSIVADYTRTPVGHPVNFMALIEGRTTLSVWDSGNGMVVSNRPYATLSWAAPGDYEVTLQAYNESHLAGVSATLTVYVVAQPPVVYVAATSPNPQPPYASWSTAATNIQQAVGMAAAGGIVVVTNGMYPGGVAVDKPLTLLSVNGPQFTVINGGGTSQCASLTNGASLSGFTLTNGHSYNVNGGGVGCASGLAFLTNCVIVGNVAYNNGGGGAYGCTLYNCTLSSNSATDGGGASGCTLYNCTLSSNTAADGGGAEGCTLYNCRLTANLASYLSDRLYGGGASGCTLYNCVLYGNSVWGRDDPPYIQTLGYGGGAAGSILYNCTVVGNSGAGTSPSSFQYTMGGGAWLCILYNSIVYFNSAGTDPDCSESWGNELWTSDPLFIDYAHGNLRLQSNSPCINAGNNAYVITTTTDLDGNPRIVSGTVDIGAYEYQGTGSRISYAWLQQYGLPTDGSEDYADPDHDGMNNWQEWVCGTNPTNALSALRLLSATPPGSNVAVTWQSIAGVNYLLERSANLGSPFALMATNILGQAGTTTYGDATATGAGPFFYRVGVKSP